MNVTAQSPVNLISGMQSEAIDKDTEVDASLLAETSGAETSGPAAQGFDALDRPNRRARRRLAHEARSTPQPTQPTLADRAPEIEAGRTAKAHGDGGFDAERAISVRPSTKLSTSSRERFERLVDQVQARPQIALGVVAAAGIMVTTLVWSKAGRLLLLAASGFVADRLYGQRMRKSVKRLAKRLPAQLTR